jgi:hypothetical protein
MICDFRKNKWERLETAENKSIGAFFAENFIYAVTKQLIDFEMDWIIL